MDSRANEYLQETNKISLSSVTQHKERGLEKIMMAEAGAQQPSLELHSLPSEPDCFGSRVTSYSEGSAAVDMCVKTEPDEEDISQSAYCTEVQGFGAEEMDSGLHLDTEHIKTETVMVRIMDDNGNLQLCSNAVELCPSSQQLKSSTGTLSKKCLSSTDYCSELQQYSKLQKCFVIEKEVSEIAHCDLKEECEELQVNELITFPCPLYEQCKSETDDVKVEQHSQLEGSFSREAAGNEAEYDLLQRNSAKLEVSLITAGGDMKCCVQCGASFSQICQLKQHQFICSRKQYECSQHGETLSQTGEKQCSQVQCRKTLSRGCRLKIHNLFHFGEKPYKCNQCGKSFSQYGLLRQHQVIHAVEKPYKCNECGKSFSQSGHLKHHQFVHSGEKPYKCSECGKCFSQGSHLKHHQLVHSGKKPYKCTECGKDFSHGSHLKKHQLIHSGEKPYKCSLCGKSFSQSGHLKQHQLVHSGEKPYECSQCVKSFSCQSTLRKHQLTHSGQKPYKCSECGKLFSRGGTLKQHQLIHSGQRPFKCSQCGKCFSQGGHLKQHQITHSGEKPYKCIECEKSFSRASHLKHHQLLHSGEEPHKCGHCGNSFASRKYLKIHEGTHCDP